MRKTVSLFLLAAGVLSAAGQGVDSSMKPVEETGSSVNLLFVGDWGFAPPAKPGPDQTNTAAAMAAYVAASKVRWDGVLVGGDNFKAKLSGTDDPNFTKVFDGTYDSKWMPMPFYAVFGSHDYEYKAAVAQLECSRRHPESRWKMPSPWYRLDFPTANPLVTVLMLDSDRDMLSKEDWAKQLRWMEGELSKPRQSAWMVCLGHHPLFSDGRHDDNPAMQSAWGSMLKKHKVDFYLSGHDHVLNHLQISGWSTSFVISGGGGENTNRPVAHNRDFFVKASHGFAAFQFSQSAATVSLVDDMGSTLHAFERDRAGQIRIIKTTHGSKAAGK